MNLFNKILLTRLQYFIFVFSISFNLNGYIINIIKLEKKDSPTIYMFSDLHDNSVEVESISCEQKDAVYQLLSSFNPEEVLVITEDFCGYTGFNAAICKYSQGRAINPQSHLSCFCNEKNIPVKNIEHRFYRLTSTVNVWRFLRNYDCSKSYMYQISSGDVVREFDETVLMMAQFDDPELNDYYNQIFQDITERSRALDGMSQFSGSVDEYVLNNVPPSSQKLFTESLEFWDAKLLDIAALHSIYENPQKNKIFMFAGCLHTNSVANALTAYLGYATTAVVGLELCSDYSKKYFVLADSTMPKYQSQTSTKAITPKFTTLTEEMLKAAHPIIPEDILACL